MTLIEGVGDEVTDFFIVVAILIVGYLAWCSTRITDHLSIRTVLILQLRASTSVAGLRGNNQNANPAIQPLTSDTTEDQTSEQSSVDSNTQTTSTSNDIPSTGDEIVSDGNRMGEENTTEDVLSNINIKLKFINDDQRMVTGSLKELLGDFKRRHFQIELQARKLVRLIFNGRILQPDSETLEKCGLYDNCVVHCLVHQPRPSPIPVQLTPIEDTYYFRPQWVPDIPNERIIRAEAYSPDLWDLSRLLVSIMSFFLVLAWYSRYYYAQLFTATTTYALYALTAIFTVSFVGNFFPDQDNIRNIE